MAFASFMLSTPWSPLATALTRLGQVSEAELRELLRLADAVGLDGGIEPASVAADLPVYVAGCAFYRPSLGALAWLSAVCEERGWVVRQSQLGLYMIAYALHHSRTPAVLRAADTKGELLARVRAFVRAFGGSEGELRSAIDAAFAGFPDCAPLRRTDPASTLQAASRHLARGGQLESWLWDHSAQQCAWLGRYSLIEHQGAVAGRSHAMGAFRAYVDQLAAQRAPAPEATDAGK